MEVLPDLTFMLTVVAEGLGELLARPELVVMVETELPALSTAEERTLDLRVPLGAQDVLVRRVRRPIRVHFWT
jgi:hypothetical protein